MSAAMRAGRGVVPAVLLPLALLSSACGGDPANGPTPTPSPAPSPAPAAADKRTPVLVHLFEWRWTDIAIECETNLGPAGFTAVQVSPPVEHAVLPGFPWWQRYQTVGYSVASSRSGTGEEFRDMVRRCTAAGVAIYVDAVINHMTAQGSGVGSNGAHYTKYSYPDLYMPDDFHMPPCGIAGGDYQNAPDRVRNCELLGLADLNTSSDHVRDQIAGGLAALVGLGVRGFRIDAAKHIDPSDLDAIVSRVSARAGVTAKPYYFLEVIDHGGEAIAARDYLGVGQGAAEGVDVTEFKYVAVADAFANAQGKTIAALRALDGGSGDLLPSDRAVVFINNHDTQRASGLFYQDGPSYDLATVFLLAWPYGHPSILSSYAFDRRAAVGRDAGPPSDGAGATRPVYADGSRTPGCSTAPTSSTGGWLCEHRRPFVAPLIAFRQATASAPEVTNWWDDGANQIAFGRGGRGFVVINRSAAGLRRTFATSLPAGAYCDVYPGLPAAAGCATAAQVTVDAAGAADITVAPWSAVVLHVSAQGRR